MSNTLSKLPLSPSVSLFLPISHVSYVLSIACLSTGYRFHCEAKTRKNCVTSVHSEMLTIVTQPNVLPHTLFVATCASLSSNTPNQFTLFVFFFNTCASISSLGENSISHASYGVYNSKRDWLSCLYSNVGWWVSSLHVLLPFYFCRLIFWLTQMRNLVKQTMCLP